jgi:tetratricopeptide (TPR) repeat protein
MAWEIFWSCRFREHQLALQAARVYAGGLRKRHEKLQWKIYEAGQRAHLGDDRLLEQLRLQLGDDGGAWADLAWEYTHLRQFEKANSAAQRAFALEPTARSALSAMAETFVRLNQPHEAIACAERLLSLYPYEHLGAVLLGILLAKMRRPQEALLHSAHAVATAPFCHEAHCSRALALFIDGQFDAAVPHVEKSLALEPPLEEDAPREALLVQRALTGDVEGLARCLARLGQQEPPEIFFGFKQYLMEIARLRAVG